ncbi:MAG: class I SAM-dependent methyltransferase [Arcobacteraceae bacterium]|jgi:2-polyprenyl-3-methyl-5-hydroxy-6-metoxy-1,4-benzoquinol methylase|nr:class I SAM-dependent methyltransferase [Arcobacteraceae bacterium]
MTNKFDVLASTWDQKSTRVEIAQAFVKTVKEKIANIKEFDLLDYGCGTGLISFGFVEDVKSITGMDFSEGMLEVYNQKIEEYDLNNVKCEKHNINDNHLPQDSFDLIVTSMTLHHIKDTADFISKANLALKPNGYLAISDLDKEDGSFHDRGNEGVEHFGFDKEQLSMILKQNGFEIIFYENVYIAKEHYPIFCAIAQKSNN